MYFNRAIRNGFGSKVIMFLIRKYAEVDVLLNALKIDHAGIASLFQNTR